LLYQRFEIFIHIHSVKTSHYTVL